MDHIEFREALSTLGLSQLKTSLLLGTDERTVRRWATDEINIPTPVDILIRLMMKDPKNLAAVQALADEREAAKAKAARKAGKR